MCFWRKQVISLKDFCALCTVSGILKQSPVMTSNSNFISSLLLNQTTYYFLWFQATLPLPTIHVCHYGRLDWLIIRFLSRIVSHEEEEEEEEEEERRRHQQQHYCSFVRVQNVFSFFSLSFFCSSRVVVGHFGSVSRIAYCVVSPLPPVVLMPWYTTRCPSVALPILNVEWHDQNAPVASLGCPL